MTDHSKEPIVYCGCWGRIGHYTWLPNGRRRPREADGDYVGPWRYLDSRKLNPGGKHGDALLTWEDGWTALGITDNSVDHRGASHSTFAMPGLLDFDAALALAREHFPLIIDRIGEITLVKQTGQDGAI